MRIHAPFASCIYIPLSKKTVLNPCIPHAKVNHNSLMIYCIHCLNCKLIVKAITIKQGECIHSRAHPTSIMLIHRIKIKCILHHVATKAVHASRDWYPPLAFILLVITTSDLGQEVLCIMKDTFPPCNCDQLIDLLRKYSSYMYIMVVSSCYRYLLNIQTSPAKCLLVCYRIASR